MFEKPAVQAQDRLYDTHKGKVKPFFQIFNLAPRNLLFSLVFSFILSFSHEAILFFSVYEYGANDYNTDKYCNP